MILSRQTSSRFRLNPNTPAPEFNIAFNSLTLIYNQAVLWFGMLFSPLLAVCVTIKFLILFYVKRECAMRACRPARKVKQLFKTLDLILCIYDKFYLDMFGREIKTPKDYCKMYDTF